MVEDPQHFEYGTLEHLEYGYIINIIDFLHTLSVRCASTSLVDLAPGNLWCLVEPSRPVRSFGGQGYSPSRHRKPGGLHRSKPRLPIPELFEERIHSCQFLGGKGWTLGNRVPCKQLLRAFFKSLPEIRVYPEERAVFSNQDLH